MKRVYCLYRVSTKKQVDKNNHNESDIPMQKKACHEYAAWQQDWQIVKEFSEHGVSGYKVSAHDRDAIQDLQAAAERHEFDVLLVFMFDRIGRIDDETPFVVEWFVKHGIEVWSTQEGQQRFETHVDKLMNYIRFWQAAGESEKTSIRIRSKMQQMILDGFYTGGPIRFGYRIVDSGIVNRKNQMVRKYEIDEDERNIIMLIDDLTIRKGYGSYRVASYLNENGYKPRDGGKFTSIKINRILKDAYYCGRLEDGTTSPALEGLQIRSEETYRQILYILKQRKEKDDEKRHIAMTTQGKAMLSGNVFCAHCGGRLTTIRYRDSYRRADGSEYKVDQIKYCCYHKSRKLCDCDGQTTYLAERVDKQMDELMERLFQSLSGAPEEEIFQQVCKRKIADNRMKQKKLSLEIAKNRDQLEKLQAEIANTLTGESLFSPQDLAQAMNGIRGKLENDGAELARLKEEEIHQRNGREVVLPSYRRFRSWAEEFGSATLEQKKMIACNLFRRIEVGRDYKITVEMNMSYQQFCTDWNENDLFLKNACKVG